MQQQVSVITLGVENLPRSRRFYADGFGWRPVFENDEISFYQMNGFVLGTWLLSSLRADSSCDMAAGRGGYALAHNVAGREDVQPVLEKLAGLGGTILRNADAPPHGGMRGYIADPDEHVWEIAWNPAWQIDEQGLVTFGV